MIQQLSFVRLICTWNAGIIAPATYAWQSCLALCRNRRLFNLFNYVILQTFNYTWKLCKQTLQIDVNVIYGNVYKKKKPCVSEKSVTSDCLVYCLQKIVYSLYQCTKCCIILGCEIAFVADIHFQNDTHRIML